MREVNDCPTLEYSEVCSKIRDTVDHTEFLFFRCSGGDDLDWILGPAGDGYEMFCTDCGQRFFEKRDRKRPASSYDRCPRCGAPVMPCRWNDRCKLEYTQFAFHLFQRGEGREVWFRSFKVAMNRAFMGDKYDIFEYCRMVFYDGGARKWTRGRDWISGAHLWKPVKSIGLKRWHLSYGQTRDDFFAGVSWDEIAGSCLEYAQAQEAFDTLRDPIEYLGLYVKHPQCEYIWKMGLGHFFREREMGRKAAFTRLFNLRAARPDKLVKNMNRQEVRALREHPAYSLDFVYDYLQLKACGLVPADAGWMAFLYELGSNRKAFGGICARCCVSGECLRRYLERQSRRCARPVGTVMQELTDYHRQIGRMQINGGNLLPHDLHEAHARLSARERKLQTAPLNGQFRLRRRLLHWMCWRHDGMLIRPVDSADELTREGEQMDNCVAGYAERHAEGKTIILLLRRCDAPCRSWHTVEIDPITLTCRQCYAKGNRTREPAAARFMEEYLAHLQTVRTDGKTTRSVA